MSDYLARIRRMFRQHRARRKRASAPPFPSRAWLLAGQRLLVLRKGASMARYLYGMHDPGGEHLFADKPGWIVFTEAIGCDPSDKSGRDYSQWANAGYGILVRLNNGYGSTGTIPTPDKYDDFALRVSNFIAASKGCDTWIIGNETNHSQERPNGQPITPVMYIDCFKRVHAHVRLLTGTRHGLIPAPVALWNLETGDWLEYQATIWRGLWQLSAGAAIHTYSHGASPHLVTSQEKMGAPYQDRFFHFQAYRDLMTRVPVEMRGLPVYITETDQNDPWADVNSGWVQEAYAEIDRWNKTDGTQKIYCLCLYRWPKDDRWSIVDKPQVHVDLRAAVAKGYKSPPVTGAQTVQDQTFIPNVSSGPSVPTQPQPDLPPVDWDKRLTARGVKVVTPPMVPGSWYWRVVKARWYNEQEADQLGPDHHIMADTLDANGARKTGVKLYVEWPSGNHEIVTEAKPGEPYSANYPMSPSRNEYSIEVFPASEPSESLVGIGMGAETPSGFNAGIHTSTGVTFELATAPQASKPQPPTTEPKPQPTTFFVNVLDGANLRADPSLGATRLTAAPYAAALQVIAYSPDRQWAQVQWDGQTGWVYAPLLSATRPTLPVEMPEPEPTPPTGDNWQRSRAFVKRWEGGFQDHDWDAGNWTGCEVGKGIKKGTNRGISACAYPNLDIRNLTEVQADDLFFRDYWQRSGADKLSWPMCLLVYNVAVNFHPNTAKKWLEQSGGNPLHFSALMLRGYRKSDAWKQAGDAWVDRSIEAMLEASK